MNTLYRNRNHFLFYYRDRYFSGNAKAIFIVELCLPTKLVNRNVIPII